MVYGLLRKTDESDAKRVTFPPEGGNTCPFPLGKLVISEKFARMPRFAHCSLAPEGGKSNA